MLIIGTVIAYVLGLYQFVLLARMVLSLVETLNPEWSPRGIVLVLAEAIYTLTDPPIKFLRKFVKPVRLGAVALDLSVLIVWFGIALLMRLNAMVFFAA